MYIAESVPALIMQVNPWIDEEEAEFQQETASSGMTQTEIATFANRLTDQLISRMRQQLITLRQQIAAMEELRRQREDTLINEIQELRRRLALQSEWEES